MTAAASGSSGITVADNDNVDFGTGNFTLVWKGSLPDWTPSAFVVLATKRQSATQKYWLQVDTTGAFSLLLNNTNTYTSSIVNTFVDNTDHEIIASVTVGAVNTTVDFYVDGVAFGAQQTYANAATVSNTGNLTILGTELAADRFASTVNHTYTYNRALTAAEVLDLYRNGVAESDKWGSQTEKTSGTLVVGKRYRINNWITNDDFTNVGGANVDGTEFTATGTTPTTWTNSSTVVEIGATLALTPEGIQPAPGQWLDSSSNKLHAMQPATGSSLTRYKKDFEYRWTNTWTASSAAQYIGGLNQALLSADHFITDVITQATVVTDVENLTLGDGSDADRFVTTFAASATRTKQTIAAQNDGTNLKLVYTPAASATMTVETIIRGFIWES
jgi:hypothetical protein